MGRQHQRVGAERHRVLRQAGVEAEVGAPGAVDQQRHAGRLAVRREGGDVGQHADVATARSGTPRSASGCAASASATRCGGIPPGRPVRGSSSGRTNTGFRPPSTKAENSERWIVRDTITVAPGRATPSAIAWFGLARAVHDEAAPVGAPGAGRRASRRRPACPCSRAGRRSRWSAAGRVPGTHPPRRGCGRGPES